MCDFISFKYDNGLFRFAPSLNSHSDIDGDGVDCEWSEDGTLSVQLEKRDEADKVREEINAKYTREQIIDMGVTATLEAGELPNPIVLGDAMWLFAADCADHVLHFYEDAYPNDDRPRKAIEAARNGDAAARAAALAAARTAARTAAWAAARDAAWAAAWAAARDAAWAAARDAARDADAEEKKWQIELFKIYLGKK